MKLVRSANAHPFRTPQAVVNPLHNELAGRPSAVVGGQSGTNTIITRILKTQFASLVGYWQLGELSGTTAIDSSNTAANGTYAGTVTLAQAGIGDGSLSALFAGGRVDLSSVTAAIDTAIGDKSKGTLFSWVKVANAGVWTDATIRGIMHIGVDANNRFFINKNNTSNEIAFSHRAGGTVKTVTTTFSATTFFSVALTWDKVADEVKAYVNGAQVGTTQTTLGVFAGTLTNGFSAIGDSSSAGSQPFSGSIAHSTLWKVALTPAEILALGVL